MYSTSESVSEGHPDKIADQLADTILDNILKYDPQAKVACEILVKTGIVFVTGEMTYNKEAKLNLNLENIIRNKIKEIGYTKQELGFNYKDCNILMSYDEQSRDISSSVKNNGAGDQGLVFGYATNETKNYMPIAYNFANELLKRLSYLRKNKYDFIYPDSKSQVTIENSDNDYQIKNVILSTMHSSNIELEELRNIIYKEVLEYILPKDKIQNCNFLINPGGIFTIGGPRADCGLTGRKIIVDSYGGGIPHGGGAFSGKDPSKVDRSGAYFARYIAKNIVASKIAKKALVNITYGIGIEKPINISLETYNTEKIHKKDILKIIENKFPNTVKEVNEHLQLTKIIDFKYQDTSVYGHFGKDNLPWEKIDMINLFK